MASARSGGVGSVTSGAGSQGRLRASEPPESVDDQDGDDDEGRDDIAEDLSSFFVLFFRKEAKKSAGDDGRRI
jgi:hypothetical protein